jgi:chaperone BCS1
MANYLKYDIYDMDLKEVQCNSDLRRLLIGTGSQSILVIEDIDCSVELQNRESANEAKSVEDDKVYASLFLYLHYQNMLRTNLAFFHYRLRFLVC